MLSAEGSGIALFGDPRIVSTYGEPNTPNVIVYLVDTLRADHLGAWGNDAPDVSPAFDRLAAEGVMFARTNSSSCWTRRVVGPSRRPGLLPTVPRWSGRRSWWT